MKYTALAASTLLLLTSCQTSPKKETAAAAATPKASQPATASADASGFVSTGSGLRYKVLASGPAGGQRPTINDTVVVHYRGTLVDGTVFDSSVERGEPAEFGVHQVIPAWTEALQMMSVGDKWRIACPPRLAYGEQGAGSTIPPNTALVFEIHLIDIKG